MKAVIPAAGFGTRLPPLTFSRPKPVLSVAGKPLIVHAVSALKAASITDIGIVVSDATRTEIRYALQESVEANITFIDQHEQAGLGHAILMARDWIGQSNFCVYLGDNLFECGVQSIIADFLEYQPSAAIALTKVANPTSFGVADMHGNNIVRLVEKPSQPTSNLVVTGLYCFTPKIFQALERKQPSECREYELTDGIQELIEQGMTVLGHRINGWWKDTGRTEDLLEANYLLLEAIQGRVQGKVVESKLSGQIILPSSSSIIRSNLSGPIVIGERVTIEDAYVGPFTTIEEGTTIRQAEIEQSCVGSNTLIENVAARMQDCLIGVNAIVRGGHKIPKSQRLVIGDASTLHLP